MQQTLSLHTISTLTGASYEGSDALFTAIDPLDHAHAGSVSFFHRMDCLEDLKNTKAGACFIERKHAPLLPADTRALITTNPYRSFVLLAQALTKKEAHIPFRHPTSLIAEDAHVHDSCWIGPGVVISSGAYIGPRCVLESYACVGKDVHIEEECHIGPHVTLCNTRLEKCVHIQAGTRIGQVGFGFLMDEKGCLDIPHQGRVIIDEHVHIGANCTIDRGSFQNTVIGAFSRIDNMVHIAHNVVLGKQVIIAALGGISGSSIIEKGCILGGQVGLTGHITLAAGTKVAAKSGVMRSSQPGEVLAGIPAMPITQWRRQVLHQGFRRKKKE